MLMSTMVFSILVGAALFTLVFRGLGGERVVESAPSVLPGGAAGATFAVLLLMFVLGMFLHGAAAIILVVPIVLPLVREVGTDPIHFGIIVTLNLAIGQQTPPVASVLITACSIAKAGIWETTRTNLPFIGVLAFILLLVTYVPWVSLGLTEYLQ